MENKYISLEHAIRQIGEAGVIGSGKMSGSLGMAFKHTSSSKDHDHNSGLNISGKRNHIISQKNVDAEKTKHDDMEKEIHDRESAEKERKAKSQLEENEPTGTNSRRRIAAVSRPTDPAPTSSDSKLFKTSQIKNKIIDEGINEMNSDNTLGLSVALIAASRAILEKKEALTDNSDKQAKVVFGVKKTQIELNPETDDNQHDSEPKPKKRIASESHETTLNRKEISRAPKMKNIQSTISKKVFDEACKNCNKKPCMCESVKEDNDINESLRLVKTHEGGNKTAKVYKDNDYDEYRVRHYTNGKHHENADYHTDDIKDAHATANKFIKESKLSPAQMKIAKLAGDPKKIDAKDLAKLRASRNEEVLSDEEITRIEEIAKSFSQE
jgi:hypothetical protein